MSLRWPRTAGWVIAVRTEPQNKLFRRSASKFELSGAGRSCAWGVPCLDLLACGTLRRLVVQIQLRIQGASAARAVVGQEDEAGHGAIGEKVRYHVNLKEKARKGIVWEVWWDRGDHGRSKLGRRDATFRRVGAQRTWDVGGIGQSGADHEIGTQTVAEPGDLRVRQSTEEKNFGLPRTLGHEARIHKVQLRKEHF